MHILVTGGTGLIGQALIRHPDAAQHRFTVLTRSQASASNLALDRCTLVESLDDIAADQQIDAVINLAGAPIVGKRWSAARKQVLRKSRIDLTASVVEWMRTRTTPPAVFLSGSAIGFYGDTGDALVDEAADAGADFGASLCNDWEAEAIKARDMGVRVCLLRTGLVLSAKGGMLKQMLLPFKLCLGSRIGHGKQWMSWIHIEDHLQIMLHLLHAQDARGPFNLVAPAAVTNAGFTRELARSVGRVAVFFAPAFLIRIALGESALLLLGGQKVLPAKIEAAGYRFNYPSLDAALRHLVGVKPVYSN